MVWGGEGGGNKKIQTLVLNGLKKIVPYFHFDGTMNIKNLQNCSLNKN